MNDAEVDAAGGDSPEGSIDRWNRRISRRTLADRVYDELRSAITKGYFPDGIKLKQAALATQLGVSRVPVREALRRLQAEQLVIANPFQQYVVNSLSQTQLLELAELREELEVIALKRVIREGTAHECATDAYKAAFALSLDQDIDDWLEADRDFHRAINGRTTAVAAVIEDVRERMQRYIRDSSLDLQRRQEILSEHGQLIAAVIHHDELAAEQIIRAHVVRTRFVLEQGLKIPRYGKSAAEATMS